MPYKFGGQTLVGWRHGRIHESTQPPAVGMLPAYGLLFSVVRNLEEAHRPRFDVGRKVLARSSRKYQRLPRSDGETGELELA